MKSLLEIKQMVVAIATTHP